MLTGLALDYLNNLDGIKELVSNDNIARLTLELGVAVCYPLSNVCTNESRPIYKK